MKTLNDKITLTASYTALDEDTYFDYYVGTTTSLADAVFIGRFFAQEGSTSTDIYLNDIIADLKPTRNILKDYMPYVYEDEYKLILRIYLLYKKASESTSEYKTRYIDVVLVYKYPFKDYYNNFQNTATNGLLPYLQGIENYDDTDPSSQSLILYPHYPVGNSALSFVQAFNLGALASANNTNIMIYDKNDSSIYQMMSAKSNNTNTYYCALTNYSNITPEEGAYIGIENAGVLKSNTIISGKKLWKIEVLDQWNEGDEAIKELAGNLGYDEYYATHFVIDNTEYNDYILYFIYETNDEDDIEQAFENSGATKYNYSYEEISSANLWDMKYDGKNSPLTGVSYLDFVRFMHEAIPSIDEEYINTVMGISEGDSIPEGFEMKLPYKIYNEQQLVTWKAYFEAFEGTGTYIYEDFFYADTADDYATTYNETYKETSIPSHVKLAELDTCPAHYYLQWIDRFGGVQCLPFNEKETKSISYSKTNIENYINEQRLINAVNDLNFEINTGWLNEDVYPLYESILVSPYLRLLDYLENKTYDVLSTDTSYTEKTFKNLKKMFNLTIKLSVKKQENIMY